MRLLRQVETNGGAIFGAGEVMLVTRNLNGLELEAVHACETCKLQYRHYVKKVRERDVALLHKWIKRPELAFESCESCGIVRRSDGESDTLECPGRVSIRPRKP